ncbi:MAG: DNA mismatch repair protein MutS [Candidatus Lokiarchaeota archaeon]|nr:DNA mismatch repair protein MutS [Candidatus Lokiarchaeota archaeon]
MTSAFSEQLNERNLTPMIKHWYSIKKKYPEHLIAYRMGDFYEFFYDDAVRVSKLLGITLTNRKVGDDKYPLAGIPHHACKNYLTNLIKKKETVVIVDQLEDPSTVKGRIVKRGVTRILSPGTLTEDYMLKSNDNNYVATLVKRTKGYGCAFADISTGEFIVAEYSIKNIDPLEKLLSLFARFNPAELIIPSELQKDDNLFVFITDITEAVIRKYDNYYFEYNEAYNLIKTHFKISNLKSFGLEDSFIAIEAAGGLLAFLRETQQELIPNIFKIMLFEEEGILHLDYTTQRNLELINSLWEKGRETSLLSIFDRTLTPMGSRLIKRVILQPLTDIDEINHRLNIVQRFKEDIFLRTELREKLSLLGDLERYINRITYINRVNARDLINIKNSLKKIPKIKEILEKSKIQEISKYLIKINEFKNIRELIENTIKDDPPITIKDGNIIKQGYNSEVDNLRDILNNGKKYLLEYEEKEKKIFNLNSGLKVGYNNILGYYIQITNRTLELIKNIPENYVERQTLKNAKRYTTKDLKILEEKILSAQEKINELEYNLFCKIRDKIVNDTLDILETSKNLAYIDVYSSFADLAEKNNYCRPILTKKKKIEIKDGRHPVIEQMNTSESFIPNDCYIDTDNEQILIITGPNMAGKSTFLRQVALICLIGQMGCFVPASSAKIGIIDQIFTRIGASDDLARKLSTFMIEMTETAKILNYATKNSLVIIDELGRGTSTSDGQSIAIATLEKLHDMSVKTLFSTHYHQLTEINLPRVKNYHLDIIENDDGSINFIRKLKKGSTDKSYGIHIAKLAGIPDDVIIEAFKILEQLEKDDPLKTTIKNNNELGNGTTKYHDKLIHNKNKQLENLNNEIEIKRKDLQNLISKLTDINLKTNKELPKILGKKKTISESNKKKTVQTSFFKPIVKKELSYDKNLNIIINDINQLNIENLTPLDAMKKLIELKEKLEKYKEY